MLERVLENWLISANEKLFQVPFCQMLAGEGYQVIHLSRHGSFEQGKDVLAIDPDGNPCAFQLKGASSGKITLKDWAGYTEQITRLVEIPIKHPAINAKLPRRVFFVTNGELDEEVRVEIDDRNIDYEQRGLPRLEVLVKGQLLGRIKNIHTNFWPQDLGSEKQLLEFYLDDGNGYLEKKKLADFLWKLLTEKSKLNKLEAERLLCSTSIFNSYALFPFEQKKNHVAIIEGWVIYLASLIAFCGNQNLAKKYWQNSFFIARQAIEQAFNDLCEELKERTYLVEGHPLVDAPFYRGRVTLLLGLVSVYALWQKIQDPEKELDIWYETFISTYHKEILLWGEAAVPQILSLFWYQRTISSSISSEVLINSIVDGICKLNINGVGLPDPYHPLHEVVGKVSHDDDINENYLGRSYSLEALVQLMAKMMWRQTLAGRWEEITKIAYAEFQTEKVWQYCLWECEQGILDLKFPDTPQSWKKLQIESKKYDTSTIPKTLVDYPELALLFLIVYPHRLNKNIVKFLDTTIVSINKNK